MSRDTFILGLYLISIIPFHLFSSSKFYIFMTRQIIRFPYVVSFGFYFLLVLNKCMDIACQSMMKVVDVARSHVSFFLFILFEHSIKRTWST